MFLIIIPLKTCYISSDYCDKQIDEHVDIASCKSIDLPFYIKQSVYVFITY
jgi:hypothetical protein